MAAANNGIQVSTNDFAAKSDFGEILNEIAFSAALRGSSDGFVNNNNEANVLIVRSAGEDAWLGLPAPFDPTIDDESRAISNFDDKKMISEGASDYVFDHSQKKQKKSYRSLRDAVDAANAETLIIS